MKKFLILFLICFVQNTFSQSKKIEKTNSDDNVVYNMAEIQVRPQFPGGTEKFHQFIAKNYKKSNEKTTLQGLLFATFIIEKDGSLNNIKIVRDIGFGTGDELLRVLKLSPKWKPGKKNNKEARTLYSLVFTVPK